MWGELCFGDGEGNSQRDQTEHSQERRQGQGEPTDKIHSPKSLRLYRDQKLREGEEKPSP